MNGKFPSLLLLALILCAGCGTLQQSELKRLQMQKEAAGRYAEANWIERRDIAREVTRYYGRDRNDLVIDILTRAAGDPQPAVRIEAVQGFAKIQAGQTLPVLKKMALDDASDNVRWYAVRALQSFKDPSTADVYARCLGSADWLIREESIKGICGLDDAIIREKMVPSIARAINDTSPSVMLAALRGVKTKDDRLYPAIAEKLRNASGYNYSLLEASLSALDGYRLDPKTKKKVIDLLIHDNASIRILALRVLKKDGILGKSR